MPIRVLSDDDRKSKSAAVKDYGASASIDSKIISFFKPRRNAVIGSLKRAIQKVVIKSKDRYWDRGLKSIVMEYRKRCRAEEKSPSEIIFGIMPRLTGEQFQLYLITFLRTES